MLIDEKAARTKFCPLSRTAERVEHGSSKFASGVNTANEAYLTRCWGSGCMLWETMQVVEIDEADGPCDTCKGEEDKKAACEACKGSGIKTKKVPHTIGCCAVVGAQMIGNSHLHQIAQTITRLSMAMAGAPSFLARLRQFFKL